LFIRLFILFVRAHRKVIIHSQLCETFGDFHSDFIKLFICNDKVSELVRNLRYLTLKKGIYSLVNYILLGFYVFSRILFFHVLILNRVFELVFLSDKCC
jgi:hypothetical protein